jgi:hypothetical protein
MEYRGIVRHPLMSQSSPAPKTSKTQKRKEVKGKKGKRDEEEDDDDDASVQASEAVSIHSQSRERNQRLVLISKAPTRKAKIVVDESDEEVELVSHQVQHLL